MFLTKNHKVYKFKLLLSRSDKNNNDLLKYYKYITKTNDINYFLNPNESDFIILYDYNENYNKKIHICIQENIVKQNIIKTIKDIKIYKDLGSYTGTQININDFIDKKELKIYNRKTKKYIKNIRICKNYENKDNVYDITQYNKKIYESFDENNIYLKGLYDELDIENILENDRNEDILENKIRMRKYRNFYANRKYTDIIHDYVLQQIRNCNIINIILKNFCKEHYIEHVDIIFKNGGCIFDTITIIIDETKEPKESNNRKITFYKNFYDFYKIRDSNKNYKILKEDEFVLIEELDTIQDITKPIENKKTSDDIIREKDAEIDKLKREIQELKKFYINS